MSVQLSVEYRLKSLDFNNLAYETLLEREPQYIKKDIRRTRRSVGRLDAATKFISWFEHNELRGDDFDEVESVIRDPTYIPTI